MRRKTKSKKPAAPSARAMRSAKRAAKAAPAPRSARGKHRQDFVDSLVTAGAQALRLPIDPAWRAGVTFNLRLVLDHAARVEAFALPDEIEPAPVFDA